MNANQLYNPSFELGTYKGYCDELNIPKGWEFWHATATHENPHDPNPWARFVAPESAVLSRDDLPENEHALFILDGDHTLKIAKGGGSWYAQLFQYLPYTTKHLTLLIQLFGDLVKDYSGNTKVWADDPQGRDGLFRFRVDLQYTAWQSIVPGQWNVYTHTFTLPEERLNQKIAFGAEIMCPFPLKNSGIFADAWSLTTSDPPCPSIPTEEEAVEAFRRMWRELFP